VDVVDALTAVLPADRVILDADRLAPYRRDQAPGVGGGNPCAVVLARSTDEVATTLRLAHEHGTPVVPRGAGSGLSGGANAIDGAITLSLERMTAVLEIDAADAIAVVQPGVVNDELRRQALARGLWYAPDPSSRDWCTIGGNVATNAGGLCCVKYGVTRDSVLALQVVLADGRITRVGHRSVKGVAGYDLVGLFVGSEGTLGVVTEVTVRLRPLPPPAITVVAVLPDLTAAGRAIAGVLDVGTPSLLELMDRTTVRAVEAWQPMGLDTGAAALLIAQSDLPGAAGEAQAAAFEAACHAAGARECYRSETEEEAEALLAARRMALPALEHLGDILIDDVAVPRGRVAELVAAVSDIADRNDVVVATLGHAGDGNLHPTFVMPRGDTAAAERAGRAFDQVLEAGLALGGTVTGEHGVGLLKRALLGRELDPVATDLHHALKSALDPTGILNPGKALPLTDSHDSISR
jgi:glycolate dehydrogenase FAD-linked subunit